jgi:hypothetical protein
MIDSHRRERPLRHSDRLTRYAVRLLLEGIVHRADPKARGRAGSTRRRVLRSSGERGEAHGFNPFPIARAIPLTNFRLPDGPGSHGIAPRRNTGVR